MKLSLAVLISVALAFPAAAQSVKAGDLALSNPVIRAVPAGVANSAGYLVISNTGAKPDKLLSASCACARRTEVHLSHLMNGQAMMMPTGPVTIPAGGSVTFGPGARHIMLVGLTAALRDGAVQPVVLKFQRAGAVTAAFQVKSRIN